MYRTDKSFMRDPATVNCRIYIGNLDESVTPDALEEHFKPHGTILGLVLQRGFGFVQYENPSSAQSAILKEHGVLFHGKKLNVKQAIDNKNKIQPIPNANLLPAEEPGPLKPLEGPPHKIRRGGAAMRGGTRGALTNNSIDCNIPPITDDRDYNYRDTAPYYGIDDKFSNSNPGYKPPITTERSVLPPERNDCEIIVVAKALTEYAEYIEHRLKSIGLVVDLLFPNEDVPIGRVLANISSRGCLYAILVMPQNEEHRSLTLNILHGIPQEHRNMPVDDALSLISRNFDAYMRGERTTSSTVGIAPAPLSNERHPEAIQILLNLLADNRQLTTLQYDRIIKYLQDKRELQYKQEVGDSVDIQKERTKQTELQNRIMSILNQTKNNSEELPPITLTPTAPSSASKSSAPILNDPTVQKALDNLLQGDILKNITGTRF